MKQGAVGYIKIVAIAVGQWEPKRTAPVDAFRGLKDGRYWKVYASGDPFFVARYADTGRYYMGHMHTSNTKVMSEGEVRSFIRCASKTEMDKAWDGV